MRVRRRGARRVVFLRGQVFFYVAGDVLPVAARIGMEDVGERAPAAVAGEQYFLGVAGSAAFILDQPQRANGLDIIAGLFLQPALPDPVGVRYPEVARRRGGRRRCEVADAEFSRVEVPEGFAGGWASPLVFSSWFPLSASAHPCVASSHAAG